MPNNDKWYYICMNVCINFSGDGNQIAFTLDLSNLGSIAVCKINDYFDSHKFCFTTAVVLFLLSTCQIRFGDCSDQMFVL